jgi:D-aminoacyl-tRNA deacylase
MRIIIQRTLSASVSVQGQVVAQIGAGLLVLLGIEAADTQEDADWLVSKLLQMRIFSDCEGKMNLSLQDTAGGLIVVSQFTLHASTKKGNRPSFIRAARPEQAMPLYEHFIHSCEQALGHPIGSGQFGADMQISLINDGPVTITMDSKARE